MKSKRKPIGTQKKHHGVLKWTRIRHPCPEGTRAHTLAERMCDEEGARGSSACTEVFERYGKAGGEVARSTSPKAMVFVWCGRGDPRRRMHVLPCLCLRFLEGVSARSPYCLNPSKPFFRWGELRDIFCVGELLDGSWANPNRRGPIPGFSDAA